MYFMWLQRAGFLTFSIIYDGVCFHGNQCGTLDATDRNYAILFEDETKNIFCSSN